VINGFYRGRVCLGFCFAGRLPESRESRTGRLPTGLLAPSFDRAGVGRCMGWVGRGRCVCACVRLCVCVDPLSLACRDLLRARRASPVRNRLVFALSSPCFQVAKDSPRLLISRANVRLLSVFADSGGCAIC
jgi:hypothetical protein